MSYNFLDKTGLAYFWGKIKDKFDSFSRNDLAVLDSKEYSGIYGSANDQENASFYFASVRPTTFYDVWRVKYKVYADVPNQNNYRQYSICEWYGNQNSVSYKHYNRLYSTSYRCYLYHNCYYLNSTGYNAGYSHALGIGLRGSTNPTSSSYPRHFKIEILETENCTVTLFGTMVKRTGISGQGSTNFTGVSETNGGDSGLRETADDNDLSQLRIENGSIIAGTSGVKSQSLCALDSSGKYQSFTTTSGTGTSKTVNSSAKFRNPMIIFSNTNSTDYANGAEVGTGYSSYYARASVDLRYSCNAWSSFTKNTPTYLECSKDSDGYFSVTSDIIVQPQNDFLTGYYYIYLGNTRRDQIYLMTLQPNHPVYYYDGSKLISENELKANKSAIPTKTSQLTNDSKFVKSADSTVTNVVSLTKAEYDALATKATNTLYNIIDDYDENIADVYSTDEVMTNKVWIDNKNIYRKVITVDLSEEHSTNYYVAHNISNIDTITGISGIMTRSNNAGFVPINSYSATSYRISVVATTANLNIQNVGYVGSAEYIIEYTKN